MSHVVWLLVVVILVLLIERLVTSHNKTALERFTGLVEKNFAKKLSGIGPDKIERLNYIAVNRLAYQLYKGSVREWSAQISLHLAAYLTTLHQTGNAVFPAGKHVKNFERMEALAKNFPAPRTKLAKNFDMVGCVAKKFSVEFTSLSAPTDYELELVSGLEKGIERISSAVRNNRHDEIHEMHSPWKPDWER